MTAPANVQATTVTTDVAVKDAKPTYLFGWSIRENNVTPAVATVLLRTGSASGDIIAAVELAANGSSTEWFGPNGVYLPGGLYFDLVAGTVDGAVFHSG